MKGIRFFAALYAAKLATVALSVMHRNGTHMPGVLAMKICPDFLGRMDKPKTIIGITGTNGKTTTANMINDILADNGYSPVNNRAGSNILGGVATTLISAVNLRGKTVKDLAVLELDERSSRLIYPYVHPTYLLCTNLFRDSYKRNAHSEFIFDILDKHIPKQTKLVLNADDLVSARLAKGNDRVYFGIEKQDNEVLNENTIIIDTPLCPECGSRLEYDFRRYHHIGSAHCTKCGFRSPKADYDVTKVNESTGRITMSLKGKQADFKAVGTSVTDTYNLAGAIAVLSEFGLSAEQLKKSVEKLEIVKSRYDEEKIGDKQVIMSVAKGQNPVACSRVFSSIKNHTGKKAVVIGRSLVVGKPAAMMLVKKNATVTICHTRTVDMPSVAREADIIIVAAGRAGVVGAEYVKEGQTIIDVGINVNAEGKLCGDVDYAAVEPIVDAITPVPGGVGSVTTSVLVGHVVEAAMRKVNA